MGKVKSVIIGVIITIIVVVFIAFPVYIAYVGTHPKRCHETTDPKALGLSYRNFTVVTADGVDIKGWIISPIGKDRHYIVIIMHGYTSCRANPELLRLSYYLARDGFWVVLFDFRAHGVSGGKMTTIGPLEEKYDAKAVVNYIANNLPGYEIGLIGYSMGAAIAYVLASKDDRINAVVADSPYPELKVVIPRWLKAKNGIPEWYSYLIVLWGRTLYSSMDLNFGPKSVAKLNKPLLIVVGTKDPLVTVSEARAMASKSPCGKVLVGNGAGHVEIYKVVGWERYVDEVETTLTSSCT